MRLLCVHSDRLEFETTTEAGEGLGETEGVPMAGRMEDCVTAFVTVESGDGVALDAVVANAADQLRDATDRLNTRKVVLFPDEHLSDDPAEVESAKRVLRGLDAALRDDFEVLRAPVGWHAAFEVACKGHPFSVRSRHVTPERGDEAAEGAEHPASEWKLLTPDGEVRDPHNPRDATDAEPASANLRAFVEAEAEGETASEGERVPHADLLGEAELADFGERGDADSLRWYPRGKLIRDSVAADATDRAIAYGGLPVETDSDPFAVARDAHFAERDLPLRLYEPSATPAMHTVAADREQAREEFRAQADLALQIGADLGLDYQPVLRVTREFYEADEAWVRDLVEDFDSPTLLEILPERRHGWAARVDFAVVDRRGRPLAISAVRLDVERAERLDVECADGETCEHPPVVHCSPTRSVERAVAVLFETAAGRDTPRLPTWLSPTQVRFVPVRDEHVAHCDALVADLEAAGVRADVDDRDETVGERIARAETDWVPYYAVVGDRELDADGALGVTVRADGAERELTVAELRDAVLDDAGDRPKIRRYLPERVSEHPRFADPDRD